MITATYIDHMGSDLSVVNAARVSFGKKSEYIYSGVDTNGPLERALHQRDVKLIHYLAKHKHISPFGHAFASFHVKAPVFVARQLVKHKFLRWNEISRRYVDDEPEFYVPDQWRGRSADKKQGSSNDILSNLDGYAGWGLSDKESVYHKRHYKGDRTIGTQHMVNLVHQKAYQLYMAMIDKGVAPEQARMILPQSTMTEFYWSGSLDAFADMCNLRCKPDTQYESQLVANQISAEMARLFPVSWVALMEKNDE
jgi:thymidylate synthase (FAD)